MFFYVHPKLLARFNLKTGAIPSEREFITQPNWNGDKLDGTGLSGITFDQGAKVMYSIRIQYLGFILNLFLRYAQKIIHKSIFQFSVYYTSSKRTNKNNFWESVVSIHSFS